MRLIDDNSDRIRAEFKSWTEVPAPIREDPSALNRYARNLIAIAALFEKSGDASLMQCLQGNGPDNPLTQWAEALRRAETMMDSGDAAAAACLLRDVLNQMSGTTGTGRRPFSFSRAFSGVSERRSAKFGNTQEAISTTRDALELCRRLGDDEGVRTYTQNLHAIDRTYSTNPTDGHCVSVVFMDSEGRPSHRKKYPAPLAVSAGKFDTTGLSIRRPVDFTRQVGPPERRATTTPRFHCSPRLRHSILRGHSGV